MRAKLRILAPLIVLAAFLFSNVRPAVHAQGTATNYDCNFTFHFSGSTASAGQLNTASSRPCGSWGITFSTTGFTSATVQFETSPDNSTWTAVTNSVCSSSQQPPCVIFGANPITAGKMGMGAYRTYGKYVRVNVTSVSGSGSGDIVVYGYKGLSASISTQGGDGPPGPAGPTGPTGPAGPGPFACEPGLGDGLNAIPAGTYLMTTCKNKSGSTLTITAIECFTDNSGSSTMNVSNGTNTGLLTGAVTCTSSFAAGTQSATVTLANNDFLKFTFVADGTSKQTTWVIAWHT